MEHDSATRSWVGRAPPCAGHANRLRLARAAAAGGRELKLALACGRPHRYEGWTDAELERPVRALAGCGVRRLVLTNACGEPSCRAARAPSSSATSRRPAAAARGDRAGAPSRLHSPRRPPASSTRLNGASCDALPPSAAGAYVAVPGPQFETPAEVAVARAPRRRRGHVGGAGGPRRARRRRRVPALALVVNRAAAVGSHDDVLAAAGRLSGGLAAALITAVTARWPELA